MYVVYSTVREGPRDRLGEWERANLVVRTALNFYIIFPFFWHLFLSNGEYIYLRLYVIQLRMLHDYALLFIRKDFKIFTRRRQPVIMSCVNRIYVRIRLCVAPYSRNHALSPRACETPEQRVRLYQCRLRDRARAYFTRCLAVISMRNLASERTLVWHSLRSSIPEAVYTPFPIFEGSSCK